MANEGYEEEFDYEEEFEDDDDDDEGFEDVEDDDDDDEGFEDDDDDDEGFEDDDDDDESFESFEDDGEDFEDDDDDDEDFEDDDDDDEGFEAAEDEDDDESAAERSRRARIRIRRRRRIRKARAQSRARARRRAAIARQRRAARRARSSAARLARKLRGVARMRKLKLKKLSRMRGSGVVTAQLPNGRRTKMKITPALASLRSVNRLSARINANNRRQHKINASTSRSVKKLASAQSAAIKKLTATQVKSAKMLSGRIVKGDNRLQKAISKQSRSTKSVLAKHRRKTAAMLNRNRQRAIWNGILLATTMPMFAAYGSRETPFSRKNMTITASLLGWMLVDEYVLDQFMSKGKNAKTWGRIGSGWSLVAPVGNALTVYLLMRNQQHLRFMTGTAGSDDSAAGSGTAVVEVPVAKNYDGTLSAVQATIVSRPVAASGSIVSSDGTPPLDIVSIQASASGENKITLTPIQEDGTAASTWPTDLKVAWVADTGVC